VEGAGLFAPDLDSRMADPAKRAQLLDMIRLTEQEPALLGSSPHLAVIAER
jgi:hypothetical protein